MQRLDKDDATRKILLMIVDGKRNRGRPKLRWRELVKENFARNMMTTNIFFSSRYTTPAPCWAQDLARGLNSSRSSWVQGCGRMGQTSRCFVVCSSPHSHVVCPSSLNPHFCIRDLQLPVPVRRRFRLDHVGHASLEPGGSDSLGLNESLCGVVWRWLDQRFSLRVRALPSRGSTEWRKLQMQMQMQKQDKWYFCTLDPVLDFPLIIDTNMTHYTVFLIWLLLYIIKNTPVNKSIVFAILELIL